MKDYIHIPIMLTECIEALQIKSEGIYVDCTTNRGGHSLEIIKRLNHKGKLICIDLDQVALEEAKERFENYFKDNKISENNRPQILFFNKNYRELGEILSSTPTLTLPQGEGTNALAFQPPLEGGGQRRNDDGRWGLVDGVLADLGLSSEELDISGRGFSFMRDEPLFMTFKSEKDIDDDTLTAEYIVNNWSQETLETILWGYADETYRGRIARAICESREVKEIKTTRQLVEIIEDVVPHNYKNGNRKNGQHKNKRGTHCATRTFQALRMAVNDELGGIIELLTTCKERLQVEGRMAIITFHSTEDRIVKQNIKSLGFKIINKKPIVPSDEEIRSNTRARSAKLRVISN